MITSLIYLTVLFPLIGFLINGIIGRKIRNEKIIGIIGSGSVGISFLLAFGSFIELLGLPADKRQVIVISLTG